MIYVQLRFYFSCFLLQVVKRTPRNAITKKLRLKVAIWSANVMMKTVEWKMSKECIK